MQRRTFLKLIAAAIAAPFVPEIKLPKKEKALSALEELGAWLKTQFEKELIDALYEQTQFNTIGNSLHSRTVCTKEGDVCS